MIVFFVLAIYYVLFLIFVGSIRENWLSLALLFLAVYMSFKTYFFRSDSSLFMALFLLFLSFFLNVNIIYNFTTFQIVAILLTAISVIFLIDYIIFGNVFCFWTFFVNFVINLPFLLYSFNCINLLLMLLFLSGEILLFFTTLMVKKYGKV